jgi:hypothetical protein
MHDVPEEKQDEEGSEEDEKVRALARGSLAATERAPARQEELDREMGDLGDEKNAVDEKFWDQSDNEDMEDKEDKKDTYDDAPVSGDHDTEMVTARGVRRFAALTAVAACAQMAKEDLEEEQGDDKKDEKPDGPWAGTATRGGRN